MPIRNTTANAAAVKIRNKKAVPSINSDKYNLDDATNETVAKRTNFKWYEFRHVRDVPTYFVNPFQFTGYRVHLTGFECVKSMFMVHNEMINIWSAILGNIISLYIFWDIYSKVAANGVFEDKLAWACTLILSFMSTMGSTVFHIFLSHSLTMKKFLASVDYWGIFLGSFGSNIPVVMYGLYYHPMWRNAYLTCLVLTLVLGLPISFVKVIRDNRSVRITMFSVLGLSGPVFLLQTGYYLGFNSTTWANYLFPILATLFRNLSISIFFFAARIPERWFPSRFCDVWFYSHFIWHVACIYTLTTHLYSLYGLYVFVTSNANAIVA